jgi:hypothetical protein
MFIKKKILQEQYIILSAAFNLIFLFSPQKIGRTPVRNGSGKSQILPSHDWMNGGMPDQNAPGPERTEALGTVAETSLGKRDEGLPGSELLVLDLPVTGKAGFGVAPGDVVLSGASLLN